MGRVLFINDDEISLAEEGIFLPVDLDPRSTCHFNLERSSLSNSRFDDIAIHGVIFVPFLNAVQVEVQVEA